MSASPRAQLPSFWASLAASGSLEWRLAWRKARARLAGLAALFVIVSAVASRFAEKPKTSTAIFSETVQWGVFHVLAFLLPLLFSARAVADDIEARRSSYWMTRPASPRAILLGKWVIGVALSVAFLATALFGIHLAAYAPEGALLAHQIPATARVLGALTALELFYCGLALAFSSLAPEAPAIVCTLYFALVEFAFGFLPAGFRLVSMNHLAQQLAGTLSTAALQSDFVPELSPQVTLLALTLAAAVPLTAALLTASTHELVSRLK